MAEFHIELELKGLKLKVSGNRDDVPLAMNQIGRQVTGMLAPLATVVEGEEYEERPVVTQATIIPAPASTKRKPTRKLKRAASPNPEGVGSPDDAVNFRHDAGTWGHPLQAWKGWQKAIWLLYVVSQQTDVTELTSGALVQTFNAHFKSSGPLAHISVNRDLAARKSAPDLYVSTDTTKEPPRWYLLEKGIRYAQQLVAEALGQGASEHGAG